MTRGLQQHGDGIDVSSATVTNENGSGPAEAPAGTAGSARHRNVALSANVRLAVLAVMIVVVGAGAGYIGSLLMPKQYAARAEIQYNLSQSVPNELLREDRRLTTQLVLLQSRDVLGPVAAENGMRPEDLAKDVSAKVVNNSEIVEVEVRDRTRERAKALLTGVIDRYLLAANRDWQDPVRSYVESQVTELESQLRDVRQQLQAPDVSVEGSAGLTQREQVLQDLLDSLRLKLSNGSQESPSGPPARVLTGPYTVAAQVSPKPMFAAATGAATGLVVAAFVVLLVARRRLRS